MSYTREPGPLSRKLIIDGQEWQWDCGKSHVKIRSPHGETKIVHHSSILGIPMYRWNNLEEPIPVTPSAVEHYARKLF